MYLIVVLFFGLIHWGVLFPPPHRELVDTAEVESWVPVYVLYDPPGALSYGMCYSNYTPVTLKLDGISGGIQVHSEYSTYMGFSAFGTSLNGESHTILAALLNQTWQLWKYSDGTDTWLQAELINCSHRGDGGFRFDNVNYINSRGMWIENKTGEQSPFTLQWNLTSGTTEEVTFECTQKEFVSFGAGYLIHIFGRDFRFNVSVSMERSFNNTYVFNNNMTSLDVQMMCNGPITQVSPTFYKVEGALIWFSE